MVMKGAAIKVVLGAVCVLIVGGVIASDLASQGRSQAQTEPVYKERASSASAPSRNYISEEDGLYYYSVAQSPNDVAAGIASPPLASMRYVGIRNGKYLLVSPDGMSSVSCGDPCEIITLATAGRIEKIMYSPNVIAGQAIDDARNGYLQAYEPQVFYGGSNESSSAQARVDRDGDGMVVDGTHYHVVSDAAYDSASPP